METITSTVYPFCKLSEEKVGKKINYHIDAVIQHTQSTTAAALIVQNVKPKEKKKLERHFFFIIPPNWKPH